MSRTLWRTATPLFAALALLLGASAAKATPILNINTTGVNNTTTSLTGGGSGDRAAAHNLTFSGAGPVAVSLGATLTASSRYVSNVAADRGSALSGGTANATANTNYTVQFTIDPGTISAKVQYTVDIDTLLRGWLTAVDDSGIGSSSGGSSVISNVTAKVNTVNNPTLSLASAANIGGTSGTNDVAINKAGGISLGPFTGVNVFTLQFTWTTTATSPQNVAGGDEHAVRLGAPGPLGGASADDYPGPNNRNINNDGHFVNVTATIVAVPEPSTLAMATVAGLGIAFFGWRRRRA